ncbi:MAG: hypothetical protein ACK5MU_00440 [Candidatus Saccharimonadales bacterium]
MNTSDASPDDIKFKSNNINNKSDIDYFSGRVKKSPTKDFFKRMFEGKRKFIVIGVAAAVVICIVVLVLWLTVWSKPNSGTGGENNIETGWSQEVTDISSEAYDILYSDSDSAFVDAIAFLDTKITETTDANKAFELKIVRANFATNNGGEQVAIEGLVDIDESPLTDRQRYELYLQFVFAYRAIGNDASAQTYSDKINELPKEATTVGE